MPARTLWDFALENDRLYETGLTISELRWLVAKGFAEHGQDTSFYGDPHRSFRPSRGLTFVPTTCFVLTPQGAEFASRAWKYPLPVEPPSFQPGLQSAESLDSKIPGTRDPGPGNQQVPPGFRHQQPGVAKAIDTRLTPDRHLSPRNHGLACRQQKASGWERNATERFLARFPGGRRQRDGGSSSEGPSSREMNFTEPCRRRP